MSRARGLTNASQSCRDKPMNETTRFEKTFHLSIDWLIDWLIDCLILVYLFKHLRAWCKPIRRTGCVFFIIKKILLPDSFGCRCPSFRESFLRRRKQSQITKMFCGESWSSCERRRGRPERRRVRLCSRRTRQFISPFVSCPIVPLFS